MNVLLCESVDYLSRTVGHDGMSIASSGVLGIHKVNHIPLNLVVKMIMSPKRKQKANKHYTYDSGVWKDTYQAYLA